MKLGGCEVVVKCGGVSMREFDRGITEDGNEVSCLIETQPGKEFSIQYSRRLDCGPPDTELTVDVYFDGEYSDGWLAPDPRPRAKKVDGEIWGSRRGNNLHPFVFPTPKLLGETPSSVDPDCLGEIWVLPGFAPKSECTEMVDEPLTGPGPARVNEKDKKPGVHCATLKELSTECTELVFWTTTLDEDGLCFVFECRSGNWLQAEGIIRKRRRRGGDPESADDSEVLLPPKPEPSEEVVPANQKPGAQNKRGAQPTARRTGQEPRSTSSDSAILERPRKIPKRSGNSTPTPNCETDGPAAARGPSVPQSTARGSSKSKIKVEEDDPTPEVKEEIGEVKLDDLKKLRAEKEEINEQILHLEKKRGNLRGRITALSSQKVKSGTRSPRPKIKTGRE